MAATSGTKNQATECILHLLAMTHARCRWPIKASLQLMAIDLMATKMDGDRTTPMAEMDFAMATMALMSTALTSSVIRLTVRGMTTNTVLKETELKKTT